ncbi:hypothetical protein H7171_02885 [Candidatus Saccharibacteria bacterium]|nr:hypothetical protein [Candidatus Saccharibacteria bacterium]
MNPFNKVSQIELLPFLRQAQGERLFHVSRASHLLRSIMEAPVLAKADANSVQRTFMTAQKTAKQQQHYATGYKLAQNTAQYSPTSSETSQIKQPGVAKPYTSNFALQEVVPVPDITSVVSDVAPMIEADVALTPPYMSPQTPNEAPLIEQMPELTERQREAEVASLERQLRLESALESTKSAYASVEAKS